MIRRAIPIVIGLVAVFAIYTVIKNRGDDKYVVKAQFKDAAGILLHYNVKIGEVKAGDVTSIDLDKNDNAIVTMKLDKDAGKIGPDATASVRPVNLLGEKYVDLAPGNVNKPEPSGTMIPKSRTAVPVELDDALNTLDPDTRGAMKIIINEAGVAMMGRGTDFNKTLEQLPPALDQAKRVVGEVAQENAKLDDLAVQGDRAVAAVNAKRSDLQDLVTSAANALQTTAEKRDKLGQTIATAPGGFIQLRRTLAELQSASGQLTPAADDLRKTAPSLASTLARVPQFQKDAQATLDEAKDVSPNLAKLGRQSVAPLKRLAPTADKLATFSTDAKPLLDSLDQGGSLKAFLGFIDGWTGVTSTRDGLSHVFRLRASIDSQTITSALKNYANLFPTPQAQTKKKVDKTKKAATPSTPAPTQSTPTQSAPAPTPAPATQNPVTKTLNDVGKTIDKAGKTVDGIVKGVTGQTQAQQPPAQTKDTGSGNDVSKALNYLLGP